MRRAVVALAALLQCAAIAQPALQAPINAPAINGPADVFAPVNAPPAEGAAPDAAAHAPMPGPAVSALPPGLYVSIDIQGPLLRSFVMEQPRVAVCAQACSEDRACTAYTLVRAGAYSPGDPPMCQLKARVDATSVNLRVTSGVLR